MWVRNRIMYYKHIYLIQMVIYSTFNIKKKKIKKKIFFFRINNIIYYNYSKSNILIIKNEIYNLFINKNTKFTHLYIPQQFDYQIHHIPGAKQCFSEIMFLSFNTRINDKVLNGLVEICQSI